MGERERKRGRGEYGGGDRRETGMRQRDGGVGVGRRDRGRTRRQ